MKHLCIWVISLIGLACYSIGTRVRNRLYVKVLDTLTGTGITSTVSRSSLDCGRQCSISLCRRHSYNAIDKKCWMSTDTLQQEITGGNVYEPSVTITNGNTRTTASHSTTWTSKPPSTTSTITTTKKECPAAALLWSYTYEPTLNLCYRIEQTGVVTNAVARQICATEGGHLVTITGPDLYNFVTARIVIDLLTPRFWIDGTDHDFDGNWEAHDGTNMNWFEWSPKNPTGGQGCLDIPGSMKMSDILCTDVRLGGFICQIDI